MKRTFLLILAVWLFPGLAHANGDALAFFTTQNDKPAVKASAPDRSAGGRTRIAATQGLGPAAADVAKLADEHGIPRSLALSVCRVETKCRYGLVGRAGERGPLQIKLQTARGLGYNGGAAGLNGYQGAYWGVKHLAVAYKKCGSARGAAKLHQAGLAASCGGSRYASMVMAGL
jgi:soluble lytic murein transglycosylase-like protein